MRRLLKKMFGQSFTGFDELEGKFAFTLAEVLITIGIIGVVAALALPALQQAYTNHITEVRLKKFYADFNNAIKLSEVDNGPHQYWDDWWAMANLHNDEETVTLEKIDAAMNKYFTPYMKISKMEIIGKIRLFVFPDGSAFTFHNQGYTVRDITFFPMHYKKIISKGKKPGINCFAFEFLDNVSSAYWKYVSDKGLVPALYRWDGTEEGLYSGSYSPCTANGGGYCTEVIRRNNWKIPKNYPAKIRY